ncbi:MAG TPA: aminodeoxychorismate synthase component I [Burkholderiales bacterium]|nr:aminodeoxychorismate synthase component I [Burkholderiales bacterium]
MRGERACVAQAAPGVRRRAQPHHAHAQRHSGASRLSGRRPSSAPSFPPPVELPYRPDSAELFEAWADRPWAMFLDSGFPGSNSGRYDVIVADPVATLVTRGALTEIRSADGVERSGDDPLTLLQRTLARHAPDSFPSSESPFNGGAVGYFAYDLGRRFERMSQTAIDVEQLPDMAVGIYSAVVIVDHGEQRSFYLGREPTAAEPFLHALPRRIRPALRATERLHTSLDSDAYAAAFARVMEYIRAGDCYQVNLARRFSAAVRGDPWAGYRALRSLGPVPYGAYLNTPDVQVLSFSPERFLNVHGDRVETRPIKGTRRRHPDVDADRRLAQELLVSAKDRAENVMIVDLLRNDLGKVCQVGSVSVEALCELESFASVHHLVSTVSGRLAPGVHALDVLRACVPGGSITGAPKVRAMQIIEEIERERRGVYCGAIGYVGFDGAMDVNIAIRTLTHRQGQIRFWAGGGIVADSNVEAEFQETLAKAAMPIALLTGDP